MGTHRNPPQASQISMGALMYAHQGAFQRVDPSDRDLHRRSSFWDDFRLYQATCGACGCWRQIGIWPDLVEIAAYWLTPADGFVARGWEFSRARVRCPFCRGIQPRLDGAPDPLLEPPEREIVDLTLEVRP